MAKTAAKKTVTTAKKAVAKKVINPDSNMIMFSFRTSKTFINEFDKALKLHNKGKRGKNRTTKGEFSRHLMTQGLIKNVIQ